MYDFLINLTPGIKWNMGKGWQVAAQAFVPVVNQYGDRYKKVRLNMAALSKEFHFDGRGFLKASGGLFGSERYGLDLKGMYIVNPWLALEAQAGLTGYCSMAAGWEASTMERVTALVGADFYLQRWNTQFRARGGRFIYEDYGAIVEAMRHFNHCTVGIFGAHSNLAGNNGNFRPASNFRLTYSMEGANYGNRTYATDPEENEREGWFDRKAMQWGSNTMQPDFTDKEKEGGRR